jgi:DNA-binding NtrC family response regulator
MMNPVPRAHVLYVLAGTKENARKSAVRPGYVLATKPHGPSGRLPIAVVVLAATESNDKRLAEVAQHLVEDVKPHVGDRAHFLKLEGRWDPWDYGRAYGAIASAIAPLFRTIARDIDPTTVDHVVCISTGTAPQWLALRDYLDEQGYSTLQAVVPPDGQDVRIEPHGARADQGTSEGAEDGVGDGVSGLAKLPPTGLVLLEGPSGAGKSTLARRLHSVWNTEQRRSGAFVAVNVAAIPEGLFDGELRGWEAGAHSTALKGREGYLEQAEGGTLLLDEIGELSASGQIALLQVLDSVQPGAQRRRVRRLGGTTEKEVDVHIVVATNRSLHDDVRTGKFRRDLYARIRGHVVRLPRLRETRSKILPLYEEHLQQARGDLIGGASALHWAPKARKELQAFALSKGSHWEFNHRDVRDSAERLALAARQGAKDARVAIITVDVVRKEISHLRATWAEFGQGGASDQASSDFEKRLQDALAPKVYEQLSQLDRFRAGLLLKAWEVSRNRAEAWRWLMKQHALPRPKRKSVDAQENGSSRFKKMVDSYRWKPGTFDAEGIE